MASLVSSFEGIGATAGVVVSATGSDFRWSHNDFRQFPSASLIKLAVLWSLFKGDDAGLWSLQDEVDIPKDQVVEGGLLHLWAHGGRLRLDDLALLMIAVSDNTAANLLIDHIGMERINEDISSLGLEDTVLGRKMMDFEAKKMGKDNYTSPRDLERLIGSLTGNFSARERVLSMMSCQKLRSKLPGDIPVSDVDDLEGILAHKTGELPGSEHDCGVIFHRGENPVIVVVLTEGIGSPEHGVEFCRDIGKKIYDEFNAEGEGTL
ncbi:serine hydrolase [Dethiosulfovibrio russensis]|uniref:serine hydrolase n=1 Tax=Dethiosulfovibrio russensis TaxID=133534 RepID=UPI001F322B8A|nr:serine hydrolase [Dethiosulfovibrio russensis]